MQSKLEFAGLYQWGNVIRLRNCKATVAYDPCPAPARWIILG